MSKNKPNSKQPYTIDGVILSCPFCGSNGKTRDWMSSVFVKCENCGASGQSTKFKEDEVDNKIVDKNGKPKGSYFWTQSDRDYRIKLMNEEFKRCELIAIENWNTRHEV